MSCVHPIIVPNNTNHFNSRWSPTQFKVPCGKCYNCRQSRSRDWQVRAYYEFLDCTQQGGRVYFYTLTFSNHYIPRFYRYKCFSWDLVDKFLKRFRFFLDKKYGCTLKVLLTSEYGELYRRPHHHALFYIYGKNQPSEFQILSLVRFCWSSFTPDKNCHYSYGRAMPGDNLGLVSDYRAILYTCKYICKDFSFESNAFRIFYRLLHDYAKQYSDLFLSERVKLSSLRSSTVSKRLYSDAVLSVRLQFLREFNHMLPFIKYSLGFGSCAISHISPLDLENCVIKLPSDNSFFHVPIPRYLLRKLFFERVFNPNTGKKDLYLLTSDGVDYFSRRLFGSVSSIIDNNDSLYHFALEHFRDDCTYLPLFEKYNSLRSLLPYYQLLFRWYLYDLQGETFDMSYLEIRSRSIFLSRSVLRHNTFITKFDFYTNFTDCISVHGHLISKSFEHVQHCLDLVSLYINSRNSFERESSDLLHRRLKQQKKLSSLSLTGSVNSFIYKPLKFKVL